MNRSSSPTSHWYYAGSDAARVALARRELRDLEQAAEQSRAALVQRHDLQPSDDIPDTETRVIKRAPKPSVTPPKKDAKK